MNKEQGTKMGSYEKTLMEDTKAFIEEYHHTVDDILYIRKQGTNGRFLGDWWSFQDEVQNDVALNDDIDGLFEDICIVFSNGDSMFRYTESGPGKWRWSGRVAVHGRYDFAINAWNEFFKGPRADLLTHVGEGTPRRWHLLRIIETWLRMVYVQMVADFETAWRDGRRDVSSWDVTGVSAREFLKDRHRGLSGYSDLLLLEVSSVLEYLGQIVTSNSFLYSDMSWLRVRTGPLTYRVGTSQGEMKGGPEFGDIDYGPSALRQVS